jgi:hypothetical protein
VITLAGGADVLAAEDLLAGLHHEERREQGCSSQNGK